MKPKRKINQSLLHVLEQMKSLSAKDRSALFLEHCEQLMNDDEEVLIVPNFLEEESR